jgi:hypothetical protein
MSMAAGEYVSVSSQSDTERADLAREKQELKQDPASEMEELARIYVRRGLELLLARQVARQLRQPRRKVYRYCGKSLAGRPRMLLGLWRADRASCWKETQLTSIVNESAIRLLCPNVVN